MDDTDGSGSTLPRPSKLPQIRSNRASTLIEPSRSGLARPTDYNATPARPQRNSVVLGNPPIIPPQKSAGPLSPPQNKRSSMLLRPGFKVANTSQERQEEESIDSIISPPTTMAPPENGETSPPPATAKTIKPRKPRPSLSDRTMETLAQIPPSPTPSKRRQSGFFSPESPMKPPSRATSALGYTRPPSQMSTGATSRIREPPSPSKKTNLAHERSQSTSAGNRRAVSSGTGLKSPTSLQAPRPASRLQQPTGNIPKVASNNRLSMIGSKTMLARPTTTRSPIKEKFGEPLTQSNGLPSRPTQNKKLSAPLAFRKPPSNGQNTLAARKLKGPTHEIKEEDVDAQDRKTLNSSQALRSVIAQAKAASKSSAQKMDAFMPRVVENEYTNLGSEADPNSIDFLDSSHVNIIKKRITNAKSDGKLNISALCLKEIPIEVLKMYEADTDGESGPAWYEAVDVTRFNAADNEFTELPESIFPPAASIMAEVDDETPTGLFAGVEAMDLHGNQLRNLPISLGRLTQLTSLSLSRNQLSLDCLDSISRVLSLKDLRLADNQLKGTLPDCIGDLENLEVLDIQGNALTEISSSIGRLFKLKILNVSKNQLTSLPMEAIFDLHISEVNASRNRLQGSLVPDNIPQVPFLQKLDVSTNALTSVTETKVDFPELQSLDISNNRVAALPNMSGWHKINFLNAEENKISEIPSGFSSLKTLTYADFGNNSLLEIDESIGLMDNLTTFKIQNNPIRERRLPKLTTEELKIELKGRTTVISSPNSDKSGSASNFSSFARAMSWNVIGDVLDRANSRLKTVEKMDLDPIAHENIRSCNLHHNQLQTIPQSLEIIGSTLTTLDLSNNKLGKSPAFLTHNLSLPNLQSLNLTSNALTTLDPLATNLSAPKLATLIVLFNRLTDLPKSPTLTTAFPSLAKLMASNNQIVTIDVDSVRGLQVLDLSSNEIEELPPRLALLEGTLRTLIVNGNKFRVPSWGVLEKGTEEILKWCRMKIPRGEEGAMEAEW
jgi:Leucine-rich repeat (LRR) protein